MLIKNIIQSLKTAIFLQARLTSNRFPNKILSIINGASVIEILIKKLKKVKNVNKIIVIIPNNKKNDTLYKKLSKSNVLIYRGSELNVLKRFYFAAKKFNVKNIIRITGDCPLIDIEIVNKLILKYFSKKYDYATNTLPPTFPDGLDVEIFSFKALEEAWHKAKSSYQKEHVTPYIRQIKKFKKFNMLNKTNQKKIRLTLDWKEDLILLKKIFNYFKPNIYLGLNEINYIIKYFPEWLKINSRYNIR